MNTTQKKLYLNQFGSFSRLHDKNRTDENFVKNCLIGSQNDTRRNSSFEMIIFAKQFKGTHKTHKHTYETHSHPLIKRNPLDINRPPSSLQSFKLCVV